MAQLTGRGEAVKACSIYEATHIQIRRDGVLWRIASVWGVGPGRALAKPSQGGFGCVLEDGSRISMWDAMGYYHIRGHRLPARQLRIPFEGQVQC